MQHIINSGMLASNQLNLRNLKGSYRAMAKVETDGSESDVSNFFEQNRKVLTQLALHTDDVAFNLRNNQCPNQNSVFFIFSEHTQNLCCDSKTCKFL